MTGEIERELGALESALEAGDFDRAAEAAVAVENVDAPPAELLRSLRTALVNERDDYASTLARTLLDRYREREADETARVERSALARDGISDPAESKALSRFAGRATGASTARGDLLVRAGDFLRREGPPDDARRDLVNAVERVLAREESLADRRSRATDLVESVDLPAAPRLLAARVAPKTTVAGGKSELALAVGNVGDAAATDVAVELSTPRGSLSTTSASPGGIDPGKRTTETATVTTDSTGRYPVTATLTAGGTTVDTARATVVATGEAASAVAAFDVNGNYVIDTPEVQRAILHYHEDRPAAVLDGRVPTREEVRRVLAAWSEARFV